ncbi:MAG: hypothetical protein U0892_16225 [Pirellulales bacterium]
MVTSQPNPYSPPTVVEIPVRKTQREFWQVRREWAVACMVLSTVLSLSYTFIDEAVLKTAIGAWPTLFVTCGLSVLSALVTRDWIFAPLTCFFAVMAGDVLAGVLRGWAYAQVGLCLGLSSSFSAPALIIAVAMRCTAIYVRKKRRALDARELAG